MSESGGGWRPHPDGIDSPAGGGRLNAPATSVVGLGAICDLRSRDDPRSQSFSVGEFATLDNGDRVMLHRERGFTTSTLPDGAESLPARVFVRQVLNVVLPDEDDGDDHPWSWLAELARSRGLEVDADQLRHLPYEVLLTDRLLEWIEGS
jgi:hypothetical protein